MGYKGWFNESWRHSLAAKGIKTSMASPIVSFPGNQEMVFRALARDVPDERVYEAYQEPIASEDIGYRHPEQISDEELARMMMDFEKSQYVGALPLSLAAKDDEELIRAKRITEIEKHMANPRISNEEFDKLLIEYEELRKESDEANFAAKKPEDEFIPEWVRWRIMKEDIGSISPRKFRAGESIKSGVYEDPDVVEAIRSRIVERMEQERREKEAKEKAEEELGRYVNMAGKFDVKFYQGRFPDLVRGFPGENPRITKEFARFRQQDPKKYDDFRTKKISGKEMIFGHNKKTGKWELQSILIKKGSYAAKESVGKENVIGIAFPFPHKESQKKIAKEEKAWIDEARVGSGKDMVVDGLKISSDTEAGTLNEGFKDLLAFASGEYAANFLKKAKVK
jgi:hypothetical protein